MTDFIETLAIEWRDAERQAWDALARYKFWMFGYHAARVVYIATLIDRLGGPKLSNPFRELVTVARRHYCEACGEVKTRQHLCASESLLWEQQPLLLERLLEDEYTDDYKGARGVFKSPSE